MTALKGTLAQIGRWIVARPRNLLITLVIIVLILPMSRRWLYGLVLDFLGIAAGIAIIFAIFIAISGWRPRLKKRSSK